MTVRFIGAALSVAVVEAFGAFWPVTRPEALARLVEPHRRRSASRPALAWRACEA
jgi:hypothetical protein